MAEFMNIGLLEAQAQRRYKKGHYFDPISELHYLNEYERDIELIKRFRFSNAGIVYLCNLLEEKLRSKWSQKGMPIPVSLQLLITLQYLGSNTFELHISRHYGISQKTVSICIHRVCTALVELSSNFIHLPRGEGELQTKLSFLRYCNLPQIIGAIDCTHIRIQGPGGQDEQSYINRKGFYSLNVQGVANLECKFENVDASWPGATHDSFVLRQSHIWQFFENEERDRQQSILLGDSGYPLKPWLMTPYMAPISNAQKRFNNALSRGRTCVERMFGQFKRRFSINRTGYRLKLEIIPCAIIACAVLHNLATEMKLPLPIAEQVDEEDEPEPAQFEDVERQQAWQTERQAHQIALRKRTDLTERFEQE